MSKLISQNRKSVISLAVAGVLTGVSGSFGAVNWVWTGGADSGATTGVYSTAGNWIRLDTGVTTGVPGSAANVIFADTVFDNVSGFAVTPSLPPAIAIPSDITLATIGFGDAITKGDFTLASDLTLGTTGTTITTSGGINRLAAGTDSTGGANNGNAYPGTTGVQTILSNVAASATQTWSIKGGAGEVLINGNVETPVGVTVTKGGGAELELTADNSATFLGSYVAQGGTTLIDDSNALGLGTAAVQVSSTTATVLANASLLTNSGVAFAHDVTVLQNPNNITVTLGGGPTQTSSTWSGAIALAQPVNLTGGGTATGSTTFQGAISGTGNVTKVDPSTVTLSGVNSYSGSTTVSAGTLLVNGTNGGGGAVSVSSGAALGGDGTLDTGTGSSGLAVANGAVLSPTGALPFTIDGDTTLDGSLSLSLDPLVGSSLDDVGTLSLEPDSSLSLAVPTTPTAPAYVLARYSTLAGTFGSTGVLPSGYSLDYDYGNADEIALVSSSTPTPEPTAAVAAAAVGSLLLLRRRRRHSPIAV